MFEIVIVLWIFWPNCKCHNNELKTLIKNLSLSPSLYDESWILFDFLLGNMSR